MNRELQKFIPRFVRFVFPYAAITIFTIVVFYKSGEISWLNKTLQAQIKDRRNFIYGAAYSNLPNYFKFKAVEISQPKIIALGSSRVLQFRSKFFNDSISFYNTGGVFNRLKQLRAFLESFPSEKLPETILLGLDQWWFNTRYDSSAIFKDDLIYNKYLDCWVGMDGVQNFYRDLLFGKISWINLFIDEKSGVEWLGIGAKTSNIGFRKDGSFAYGKILYDSISLRRRINNTIGGLKTNNGSLLWSKQIDKNSLNELRILLRFCKKHKIAITGFLPPIDLLVWSELKKQPAHFPHFFNLYNQLFPIFRDYGFHVYDFSNPENYGSNTFEMVDAVHGSEKSFLKLYLELLRSDTYLNKYSDSTFLKTVLNKTKGNFEVFGNK